MQKFTIVKRTENYVILYSKEYDDSLKIYRSGLIERHPTIHSGHHRMVVDATVWVAVSINEGTKGYRNFTWHSHTQQYHVILAEAFADKSGYDPDGRPWSENELLEVDHINHDRYDNSVDNLQWVSRRYNRVEGNRYRELHPEKYPNLHPNKHYT